MLIQVNYARLPTVARYQAPLLALIALARGRTPLDELAYTEETMAPDPETIQFRRKQIEKTGAE